MKKVQRNWGLVAICGDALAKQESTKEIRRSSLLFLLLVFVLLMNGACPVFTLAATDSPVVVPGDVIDPAGTDQNYKIVGSWSLWAGMAEAIAFDDSFAISPWNEYPVGHPYMYFVFPAFPARIIRYTILRRELYHGRYGTWYRLDGALGFPTIDPLSGSQPENFPNSDTGKPECPQVFL